MNRVFTSRPLEAPLPDPMGECRVLFIDGPDGTGKTTYARYVAASTGAVYLHRSRPTPGTDWMTEHLDPVLDLLGAGRKVVMDRGPVGNPIWTKLFNDPDSALFPDLGTYRWCLSTFGFLGARVEIVLRDPDAIAHQLQARGPSETPELIAAARASVVEFLDAYEKIVGVIPTRLLSSDLVHHYIQQHQGETP